MSQYLLKQYELLVERVMEDRGCDEDRARGIAAQMVARGTADSHAHPYGGVTHDGARDPHDLSGTYAGWIDSGFKDR